MRYLLVLVLAGPLLAGCFKSTEEVRAQLAAKDDRDCQSYGAQPGSPAYVQCRATRAAGHDAANAAETAILANAPPPQNNQTATQAGPALAPLPPPPQRCQTMHLGMGQYRTNCY
ncbi:hypothetical protein [Bradyrhizobium sp. HKCCYLS20291]|uniref:hypothetical protein n=1 Tax=Bradyrhizobium sp. HKCCYLS20291 TaxID=3420766 RepID=UPI003EBB20D8